MLTALLGLGAMVVGLGVGAAVYGIYLRQTGRSLDDLRRRLTEEANEEKERVLRQAQLQAQAQALEVQEEHERQVEVERAELVDTERRLRKREATVERKNGLVEKRERELRDREAQALAMIREAEAKREAANEDRVQAQEDLERIAVMSQAEARARILQAVEQEARAKAAQEIERIEAEARAEADQRATKVIATAVQRLASGFVSEKTISVVDLPNDDMKGRIIGREGRNIRAIESATGVDLIIDDTPEVVLLSSFNPVRREIAKRALDRLIEDGRIHPARIEEVVGAVTAEMDEVLVSYGENAALELGIAGLHPELTALVGALRFRVVNGQNLWNHAVETAAMAGVMAHELGLSAQLAKRAGLLHDIGRAVDHETEGSHPQVAADLCRRHGERTEVVDAVRHHHEADPPSVLGVLVQAADTLSRARPGARREALGSYIKRLDELERTALSFEGVEHAYALQSGREVRVMVNYEQVSAQKALVLSGDIARRIEDTLTYPGEVRVTVLREARATEIAR